MSVTNEIVPVETAGDVAAGFVDDNPASAEVVSQETPIESTKLNESKRNNRINRKKATDEMVAWFAACARCSFFLAGYRVTYGLDEFEAVAVDSKAGWLSLNWSQSMCKLVRKSYGNRMDTDCFHYEGSCPECHRKFTYRGEENGDGPAKFRIELRPRSGRIKVDD